MKWNYSFYLLGQSLAIADFGRLIIFRIGTFILLLIFVNFSIDIFTQRIILNEYNLSIK